MLNVSYCERCFMPSTRPRMAIDESGVCSACRVAETRPVIDYKVRLEQLHDILQSSRSETPYDCIVAWSGGKDSSAIALHLRNDFGLNPLLVTFSPLIPTREGENNRAALLNLGFDSMMLRPNQEVSRVLSRRFFIERGDPKVHWNAGINAGPMRVAANTRIPLVFYAEHGESEYGGRVLSQRHLMERDLSEVLEHQIGDDPMNWASGQVTISHLYPYRYPESADISAASVRALYFAYFTYWDVTENYKYVSEQFPFEGNSRGRTYGTFNDYDSVDDAMDDLYYYMQYIKFGFGRCLRDCARMIQRGRMSREEAFGYINDYDGEFPADSIDVCLDYLRMDRVEFEAVVDRHRSSRVWERASRGWRLKNPPSL
jgi:N-acetyl sugar amidotransferase